MILFIFINIIYITNPKSNSCDTTIGCNGCNTACLTLSVQDKNSILFLFFNFNISNILLFVNWRLPKLDDGWKQDWNESIVGINCNVVLNDNVLIPI